jgi:hypothetical protein
VKVQILIEGLTDEDVVLGECEVRHSEELPKLYKLLEVAFAMETVIIEVKRKPSQWGENHEET